MTASDLRKRLAVALSTAAGTVWSAPPAINSSGVAADVLYSGAAPTLLAGLFQVNVRVPGNAPSGNSSVVLRVGNATSQPDVTLAIQ